MILAVLPVGLFVSALVYVVVTRFVTWRWVNLLAQGAAGLSLCSVPTAHTIFAGIAVWFFGLILVTIHPAGIKKRRKRLERINKSSGP